MNDERTDRIRALNDQFRSTLIGGKIYMTAGADALSPDIKAMVMHNVMTFDAFTIDNDPHGEHDFGSFELDGHKLFWKIDYYSTDDPDLGSEDPSDGTVTERALTIMLADEY